MKNINSINVGVATLFLNQEEADALVLMNCGVAPHELWYLNDLAEHAKCSDSKEEAALAKRLHDELVEQGLKALKLRLRKHTVCVRTDCGDLDVEIVHGHGGPAFWLVLSETVATPLATVNEEDGSSYCYLGLGQGPEYRELRVYDDGYCHKS